MASNANNGSRGSPSNTKAANKQSPSRKYKVNKARASSASDPASRDIPNLMSEKSIFDNIIDYKVIDIIRREGGQEAVAKFFKQLGRAGIGPPSQMPPSPPAPVPSLASSKNRPIKKDAKIEKVPSKDFSSVRSSATASGTAQDSKPFQQNNKVGKQKEKKQPPQKQTHQKSTVDFQNATSSSQLGYKRTVPPPLLPQPPQQPQQQQQQPAVASKHVANRLDNYNYLDDVKRRIKFTNQKVLVLMRGCPGSGKTTMAKQLKYDGIILSADDFFMHNGHYIYDALKLPEAHASVRFKTLELMQRGITPIIIDNTNLESWEMEPYMLQAVKLHYFVALVEPDTPWRYDAAVLAKLNTHNVPHAKIADMLLKFDHRVNVHVLRKMIQPKIDIYKQQKMIINLHNEAENSANAFVASYRLPSVSEIISSASSQSAPTMRPNKSPTTTPILDATPTTTPTRRPLQSKFLTASSQHSPSSSKSVFNSVCDVSIVDTTRTNEATNLSKTDQLLSPSMKDLMDINFVATSQTSKKVEDEAITSSNDWKIPPYPNSAEKSSSTSATSSISIKVKAESLINFLEPDSAQLSIKKISVNDDCKKESHVTSELEPVKEKSNLEKGFEAIRQEDAVRALRAHFSSISEHDLHDLVFRCDGDVHWAANLLLDSGYKWKQNSESEQQDGGVDIESNFSNDNREEEEDVNVESEGDDDYDDYQEGGSELSSDDMDSPHLIMQINPIFAMQLEKEFGPVGFNVATESYYGNDLNVEINAKIACKIHSLWSRSLAKKFQREEDTLKEILSDENYAERLQQVEDAHIAAKLDAEERDPNFPALTNEALILEAQAKHPEITTVGLASKIKRQQLYDMFPKIDRKAIDNVFNAHDGNLVATVQAIEASFHPHELPSLVIAPEMKDELEKIWLKIAENESLQTYNECNESEAAKSVDDPNYDDLRAEATVHYHRRQECFTRAQEAHGKNMKAVASFYSQQGHLHSQKLHEANKRAKQIILAKVNASQDNNTLDLHMLYVQEAMEILADFLKQKKNELKSSGATSLTLSLITGKGIHSSNGLPRIKPAVMAFLTRHDYSICDVQGGVIEVILTEDDLD